MGSIVQLDFPVRQTTLPARQAALIQRFAEARRPETDVFWLKENAEILNILVSTNAKLPEQALSPFKQLYEGIDRRLGFFLQYYRFLISICLDLEDLGTPGSKGTACVERVCRDGLVDAELSDLQRAEARRLCLRRDVDPLKPDTGLDDRLRAFGCRNTTFTIPNKKASYELTHIVFYLSEYGGKDPELPVPFVDSLQFAGTVAFLEMNIDLLAEVCIALRFAGQTPPKTWEKWLVEQARNFVIRSEEMGWMADDYHPYLMTQWFMSAGGYGGFSAILPEGSIRFSAPRSPVKPLRELSECVFQIDIPKNARWSTTRREISNKLSVEALEVVEAAEQAIDFEAFFHGFARADSQGALA